MTYEPGTADILTTCDPPFPPDEDNKLVANAILRALRVTRQAHLVQYGDRPWRVATRDGLLLHTHEYEALRRLMNQ